MVLRPLHGAEAGALVAVGNGMGFAGVEEGVPDPLAAMLRQQDRLPEIEGRRQVIARRQKRLGEFSMLVVHAGAGGAADDFAIVRPRQSIDDLIGLDRIPDWLD